MIETVQTAWTLETSRTHRKIITKQARRNPGTLVTINSDSLEKTCLRPWKTEEKEYYLKPKNDNICETKIVLIRKSNPVSHQIPKESTEPLNSYSYEHWNIISFSSFNPLLSTSFRNDIKVQILKLSLMLVQMVWFWNRPKLIKHER